MAVERGQQQCARLLVDALLAGGRAFLGASSGEYVGTMIMRKHLVLAAVGDESVHSAWLMDGARSYDVALAYSGDQPGRFADDADYYVERKGMKFSLLHDFTRNELARVAFDYDYIWMPDDDVKADSWQIERLFALAAKHRLAICQPAIGSGEASFETLRAHPEYLLRFSQFVEIMCPLFSRDAFVRVVPTFTQNVSAWGLDWLWASMFNAEQIAVIDAVAVDHTRPLKSGDVHQRLAELGVDPFEDHRQVMQLYHIENLRFHRATCRGTSRLKGIRLDGQQVWTRSLLSAVFRRKAG